MIKTTDKEKELLEKMVCGEMSAMKQFFDTYSGYLTAVCSRYISNQDDVKDILQESFIKILKSIKTFEYRGEGSLRAWASRIVVNESLKFLKANEKLNTISTPSWDLPDVSEEEDADFDNVPTSTIMDMIRSLPTGYRTVFNLFIFEEKSHKEIAAMLNISENTSASQLHRAKGMLAKQISEYRTVKHLEL